MLSRALIIEYLKNGIIHLDPAPEDLETSDLLQYCSIDLSLGDFFWIPKVATKTAPILNSGEKASVGPETYWALHKPGGDITIPAGGTVLGHTDEFVGSKVSWLTAKIRAKSSAAGWGLEVGADALFGDPGYIGRWTLRLTNNGVAPLSVPVGAKIAQIYFEKLDFPKGYEPEKAAALYKGHRNTLRDSWHPGCMLPKPLKLRTGG